MSVIVRLPAIVLGLRREHRRVELARLRLAQATSTLQSDYRGIWRRTVGSPKGLLFAAGLGLTVGLLGHLPARRIGMGPFRIAASVAQGLTGALRRQSARGRPSR